MGCFVHAIRHMNIIMNMITGALDKTTKNKQSLKISVNYKRHLKQMA